MKKTQKYLYAILFSFTTAVWAQSVPTMINYQGMLTGQAGSTLAAGPYVLQFRIWDSPTNTSATDLIWGQLQNVTVQTNGVFNVILGSPGGSAISGATPAVNNLAYAFTGSNCFLGLTVTISNGVAISIPSEIIPRQQLLSVPFAVQAQQAVQAQIAFALASNLDNALCPPATVVAYMGTVAPPGWLICDGSSVSRTSYSTLFGVIGTSSGGGDGATTFNLPDMRGIFLRGLNGTRSDAFADPDYNSTLRVNIFAGGNAGNALGSYQADQFASHTHGYNYEPNVTGFSGNSTSAPRAPYGTAQTSAAGGNETRPKNVYVNYIIKF